MEARFNTSAYIANDSQAAAMGESTFGIGRDSHHIVISGRVSQFGELFLQAAQAEARCRALPAMVDETTLSYSVLGEDVVVLGSSALVLKHELGIV